MEEDKNLGGAPTKFKDEFIKQAYKLTLLGSTDQDLADFFEVCKATINNWKLDYPKFLDSIKKGKELADSNIAKSLYNRALGYKHQDVELKVVSQGSGLGSSIEKVEVTKIYPPDTTAAIFWLKNRQPSKWRDKQEIDNTNKNYNVNVEVSEEEAKKISNAIMKDI